MVLLVHPVLRMDALTTAAASGMRARMESLDLLANNLANAATSGYKVDREFYSLYRDAESTADVVSPVIDKPWTDFSQGPLQVTGQPLDIGLEGKGFFAVNGRTGPLYTRSGAFHLSPAGEVVNVDGFPLRLTDGTALRSTSNAPFQIAADGTVQQGGVALGKLEIVDFGPDSLVKQGTSLFRAKDDAQRIASSAQVHQGKLEGSNVGSAESAVRLVNLLRQFEMLQRAISIGSDMSKRSIEEVARVGQ